MTNNMANIQKNNLHTINYSAQEMAQKFDYQYFETKRYKLNTENPALDNNTDFVRHSSELSEVYKTLLFRMRNIAKHNKTAKETKEQRKPRIQFCGYSLTSNDNTPVNLCQSTSGSIFFNGIANCGGYWRCPVCAVKITEQKKELVATLIGEHQKSKLNIGFITLTIRHKRTNTLKGTLTKLLDNYRKFQNQRFFSRNKTDFGLIGQIKTLEITWNYDNGWHPHLHLLYFYDHSDKNKIEQFQKRIISDWFKFRDNNGTLSAQNQQILTHDISSYTAKFDIAMEMTKGTIKGSKGLTPYTALAKLALNDYENIEQKRLLFGLYSEYVEYTQNRHFVNISNSIRALYKDFILEIDKTDDEIVNEVDIDKILLKISVNIWKLICKNDLQPLLINKYKEAGLDGVIKLLTYFKDFKNLDVIIDNKEYEVLI